MSEKIDVKGALKALTELREAEEVLWEKKIQVEETISFFLDADSDPIAFLNPHGNGINFRYNGRLNLQQAADLGRWLVEIAEGCE